MTKTSSARYTFEFKQEAVPLAENGQSIAVPARTLGVVDQALSNWVRAHKQGKLKEASSKAPVSAELMSVLCNSKADGLPGKPVHELGYGMHNPGARSDLQDKKESQRRELRRNC